MEAFSANTGRFFNSFSRSRQQPAHAPGQHRRQRQDQRQMQKLRDEAG